MKREDHVMVDGIRYEWLGQSTVRITTSDGFVVYTDPVVLDDPPQKADLIVITHHHVDHCLPEYVSAIRTDKTRLTAFHPSYIKYCAQDIKGVRTVRIGETVELSGVRIKGVEAYTHRGFHLKGEGCGFLIELRGQRIYFSGDTARIKEMEDLKGIDVAIMCICDNIHAIRTEDIVEAVKAIKPRVFIPVHFTPPEEPEPSPQNNVMSTKDPRYFTRKEDPARLLPLFEGSGIKVALLKKKGTLSG